MFKFENGITAESKVDGFKGVITARSENLYGCNRYYVQPKVDKDGKHVDGCWFDEEELKVDKKADRVLPSDNDNGGPSSPIK